MNRLGLGLCVGMLFAVGCANHVTMRERGYENLRTEDFAAAVDNFQKAVELKPVDHKSQYYLGLALLRVERPVAAQTPLEQAMVLRPDDTEWRPMIADLLAESYYQQDRVEVLYQFLDTQIEDYRQLPIDYYRKGKYLGLLGDADGQKIALQKAAYFSPPGDAKAYLILADFYESVNDIDNTLLSLKQAYAVNPNYEPTSDRLRGLGIVPGPTVAVQPPKPEIVD